MKIYKISKSKINININIKMKKMQIYNIKIYKKNGLKYKNKINSKLI